MLSAVPYGTEVTTLSEVSPTPTRAGSPPPLTVISLIFFVFSLIHFSRRIFSVALMSSLSFLISWVKNTGSRSAEMKGASRVPCPLATSWACTLQLLPLPQGWGLPYHMYSSLRH